MAENVRVITTTTDFQQEKIPQKNPYRMHFPLLLPLLSFLLILFMSQRLDAMDRTGPAPCTPDSAASCTVDHYIGSEVIFEDQFVRIWNFTLAPGQMTSMHRHMCNYYFVAVTSTELEVYLENGERSFSFHATGTLGFRIEGDNLVQTGVENNTIVVPRTHAARNIGNNTYQEILFESKAFCVQDKEL